MNKGKDFKFVEPNLELKLGFWLKSWSLSESACQFKYSGRRLMGSLWDREKLIPITDWF